MSYFLEATLNVLYLKMIHILVLASRFLSGSIMNHYA